ncbi:Hpt domain-containing protein [Bacteroidota bacterium]
MSNIDSELKQPGYIDLSYLKEIAGNDQTFIVDMIETYLDNIPSDIKEMKSLLADKKWNEIGDIAHKIKPSIGFLGIHMLKDTVLQLQINGREAKNISIIPDLIAEIERVNESVIKELQETLNNEYS